MKKQIFILVLALFASFQIFAQTPHDAPTCIGTAATPSVGVSYPYTVTIPNANGYNGDGTYTWYVMTQDELDLMSANRIAATNTFFTATGTYNSATAAQPTINITWTSAALATGKPYFLVVVYEEVNACTTNNMKVYRIDPINTFWLAIDNVTDTQCAAPVSSALLNTAGTSVTYLYGTNVLQTTVKASGYTGNFDAVLRLAGFDAAQTVVVTWSGGTFTAPATNNNGNYTATLPSLAAGQDIVITITVTNGRFENTAGQTIAIAVDGSYTSGTNTFNDKTGITNTTCNDEAAFADAVTQTITARPTVSPNSPAAFVPVAP